MKRIIVAVLLSASACGGGNGEGGGSIPIDDLEARVTDALCSYEVRCGWAPDKAGCAESLYTQQQLFADVTAGRVIYDGHAAAACLDLYRLIGCSVSGGFPRLSQTQSCHDTFKGTVATGGACLTTEECQSQACDKTACTTTTECCAGTCVAKILEGGDCSAVGARCDDDLLCKRGDTGNTGICAPPIADGQPCTSADGCASGRVCNVVKGTSAGTCGVLPARGQECPGMACDSSADFCDPASKTCAGRIPVGGDCAGLPTGCVVYARCDEATMKCVARKRAGEACAQSSDCLSSVECKDGICVPHPDQPACM